MAKKNSRKYVVVRQHRNFWMGFPDGVELVSRHGSKAQAQTKARKLQRQGEEVSEVV